MRILDSIFSAGSLPNGTLIFYRPDRVPLNQPNPTVTPGDAAIRAVNNARGIHPNAQTPIPSWAGERPDYGYIVDVLLNTTAT